MPITAANKQRILALWLRFNAIREIKVARAFYALFQRQSKQVAKLYRSDGQAAAEHYIREQQSELERLFTAAYKSTINDAAAIKAEQIRAVQFASFDMLVDQFIRANALIKSTIVSDTTLNLFRRVIADASKNGGTINEIAAAISGKMPQYSGYRAQMIARTEVHGAANFANHTVAAESGIELLKSWLSAEDDVTRPWHAEMDSKPPIPLNDYFNVDGDQMMYPGDQNGSPRNVINCRCTEVHIPRSGLLTRDRKYVILPGKMLAQSRQIAA